MEDYSSDESDEELREDSRFLGFGCSAILFLGMSFVMTEKAPFSGSLISEDFSLMLINKNY